MTKLTFLRFPIGVVALTCLFGSALGTQPETKSDPIPSFRDQLNHIDFGGGEFSQSLVSNPLISESKEQSQTRSVYSDQLKSLGFGEDIKFTKIDYIAQLENLVADIWVQHPMDSILVVLDWDNTVSLVNGYTLPLREGAVTSEVLQNLAIKYNVKFVILTSRFAGYGPDDGQLSRDAFMASLSSSVCQMHEAFPLLSNSPVALKGEMMVVGNKSVNELGINRFIITDGIVFAGSHTANSMKGIVLAELMRMNFGLKDFNHILFVDNEMVHINSVANIFIHRADKYKITLVHYPQIPLKVDDNPFSVAENK